MVLTPKLVQLLVASAAVAALLAPADALPRVSPSVHRTLRQQGTIDLMVTLKQTTDSVISSVKEASFDSRGAKIETLVSQLESLATSSQQEINQAIAQESAGVEPLYASTQSFWISNQVSFKGATFALVEKLAALPSIAEIREAIVLPAPTYNAVKTNSTGQASILSTNEWGVTKIQAPDVWAAGFNGQDVVVGSIDTGVLATHTSLAANWRSSFGWYDPGAKKATPYDDAGHGTHTIGTILGLDGIGVAPGAKFISCRGCTSDDCSEPDLLACAQFMTCPTDPTGTTKDCSKAPKAINNSWGGGQGDTFFAAAIQTWRAAGIIPIFAIGNTVPGGPRGCGSAASPGDDANVISVGATDSTDTVQSWSLKGPSVGGVLKPEITAPGVSIRSAWNTGNSEFSSNQGTSMAAPHVSGVVALLLSRQPDLTYDRVKQLLTSSTERNTLKSSGLTCGGTSDKVFPNNQYGYGRLNALNAINALAPLPTPTPKPDVCANLDSGICPGTSGCDYDAATDKCFQLPPPTPAPTPAPTPSPTAAPTPAPTAAPTPAPPPAPTPAPTPAAGQCVGLNSSWCGAVFFCTWDELAQTCRRWWN